MSNLKRFFFRGPPAVAPGPSVTHDPLKVYAEQRRAQIMRRVAELELTYQAMTRDEGDGR